MKRFIIFALCVALVVRPHFHAQCLRGDQFELDKIAQKIPHAA